MNIVAILYCAGSGSRLQWGISKALVNVAGQTVLQRLVSKIKPITTNIIVISGYKAHILNAHAKDIGISCVENPDWANGISTTTACAALHVQPDTAVLRIDGDSVLLSDIPVCTHTTIFVRTSGPADNYQTVYSKNSIVSIKAGTAYPLWSKLEYYAPGDFHKVAAKHITGPYFGAINRARIKSALCKLPAIDINTQSDLDMAIEQVKDTTA